MANIDVTELMSDPDFVDDMKVVTRVPRVNNLGENTFQEQTFSTFGSVQPADAKTVDKLPDELRVEDLSSFWFKGEIIASKPARYSTVLIFKGQRYQVKKVSDWSNFGRGYTQGVCVAEAPAP